MSVSLAPRFTLEKVTQALDLSLVTVYLYWTYARL